MAWHGMEPHDITLHCIASHRIALLCFALHCFALLCIALHCIALLCIALHCIASHHSALHSIDLFSKPLELLKRLRDGLAVHPPVAAVGAAVGAAAAVGLAGGRRHTFLLTGCPSAYVPPPTGQACKTSTCPPAFFAAAAASAWRRDEPKRPRPPPLDEPDAAFVLPAAPLPTEPSPFPLLWSPISGSKPATRNSVGLRTCANVEHVPTTTLRDAHAR